MPLYEYRCTACDTTIEKLRGQPEPSIPCPRCGAEAPRTVSACAATSSGDSGGGCAPRGGFS